MNSVNKYARENIKRLTPYSTARDEADDTFDIYLDANENPYDNGMNRYPDPKQKIMRRLIAEKRGTDSCNVFAGNGSDEAIDLMYRVFCNPGQDNALAVAPTYGMYKVAASVNDVEYREVLLERDFSVNTDKILSSADDFTKLLFICSPNNPTGNRFVTSDILRLVEGFGGIVVVDEAYIDFSAGESMVSYIEKYDNLVVLQTLSKAFGLAGLRIGLAFARKEIIELMDRVKYPYNINVISQKYAIETLLKGVDDEVAEIISERTRLSEKLKGLSAVKKVYASDANFLLVKFDNPNEVYNGLAGCGIVVRNRSNVPLCDGCLRITIGTPEQNDKVIEYIKTLD